MKPQTLLWLALLGVLVFVLLRQNKSSTPADEATGTQENPIGPLVGGASYFPWSDLWSSWQKDIEAMLANKKTT